jgi:hypothetical protein
MKKIYLCGPISGREEKEYKEHFEKVCFEISKRAEKENIEFVLVSPPTFPCKEMSWEDALKYCVKQMVDCDGIAVLQGWKRSKGCRLELELAGRLKIPVVYIEPPVGIDTLTEFLDFPICSDVLRYYKKRFFETSLTMGPLEVCENAGDLALLETENRFLNPHGFEYISKEEEK